VGDRLDEPGYGLVPNPTLQSQDLTWVELGWVQICTLQHQGWVKRLFTSPSLIWNGWFAGLVVFLRFVRLG
jgi:hypothetical protein